MTPLAVSISEATIWSVTFDDTRSVDYDRNSFIIQATVSKRNSRHIMGIIAGSLVYLEMPASSMEEDQL